MLEQPVFGRRLRQLRTERGLTLAALAGEGMSTGYLSRLESGARQPTERAVAHLAAQLGISPAELAQSTATSLAQSLTLAAGLGQDEAGEALAEALKGSGGEDPLLRWQALWQVAEWRRRRREFAEQREALDELATLSAAVGLPELQVRTLAELARCMRNTGGIHDAVATATRAYELAKGESLPARVLTSALLALVSALAESGRLPEADRYADELLRLVEGQSGVRWAEALWTAAAVRSRQGDPEGAAALLDRAIGGLDGRDDPTLWMRLRVSAAWAGLLRTPPRTEEVEQRIEELQACMSFAGTPGLEQELLALRARVAVLQERPAEARALLARLEEYEALTPYQERIRLDMLRNRVRLMEGERDEAVAALRKLAEDAQASGNMDLAAEIWRMIADSVTR